MAALYRTCFGCLEIADELPLLLLLLLLLQLLEPFEAVGVPWAPGTCPWAGLAAPVPLAGDSNGASCYARVGSRFAGLLA